MVDLTEVINEIKAKIGQDIKGIIILEGKNSINLSMVNCDIPEAIGLNKCAYWALEEEFKKGHGI